MVLHAFPHKTLEVKAARLRIQGVPYLYSGLMLFWATLDSVSTKIQTNIHTYSHLNTHRHTGVLNSHKVSAILILVCKEI